MLGPTDNNMILNYSSNTSQKHYYSLSLILQMIFVFILMLVVYLSTNFFITRRRCGDRA
jgi:hypothetical protein